MYTCSNCGVVFEGKVCPNCCTMRPAAAVLSRSGQILKGDTSTAAMSPGQRAARLAEDIEQSRIMDARRQAELLREEQRRRAEEERLEALRRQQEAEQEEERQRLARQAERAANWQRKAPAARTAHHEQSVSMPDALRSLKITGGGRSSSGTVMNASLAKAKETRAKGESGYPSAGSIPPRKGGRGLSSAPSERIDAAWRLFAREAGEDNGDPSDPQ